MQRLNYIGLILCLLSTACSKMVLGPEPTNTPDVVFERFWQQIDQNYSGLTVRPVNWDSLYRVYRPQVNAQTTDAQLIPILQAMIVPFKDNHVGFTINGRNYGYGSYDDSTSEIPDYLGQPVVEQSIGKSLEKYRGLFFYGKTNTNTGYIYISSFLHQVYSREDFEHFDQILEELKDTKALIIDLRFNGGGDEDYARLVAGRFADTPRLYKYTRTRTGSGRNDYSDFSSSTLAPRGDWQYSKPVVVLTNKWVFSTGNNFLMMMRVQPNVTTIGTQSGDGVAGAITRELPNGWLLNIPSDLTYLPDKTVVEGRGIPPQINVSITAEDRRNQRDTILEKALALLK